MDQLLFKGDYDIRVRCVKDKLKIGKDDVIGLLQPFQLKVDKKLQFNEIQLRDYDNPLLAEVLMNYELKLKDKVNLKPLSPHKIQLTTDNPPVNVRNYRNSIQGSQTIKETVNMLLEKGKVQESNSLWNFPILLVPKKNGEKRLCIDYRQINKRTVMESCPPPNIEECLNHLGGALIF